jgi:RHS repeat-associated protein
LHVPGLCWRYATFATIVCLVGSDPRLDFWSARAQSCAIPSNASTETTRITEFTYDFDGHVTQVNCPEGVINYGYDLATGRHTSTCTTNSLVQYNYDELGRLKTVALLKRNGTNLISPEITTYTYTKVGSRSTVSLPNGVVTTYQYDELNRLTNLTHVATNTLLASYSYQLHATGRRTGATEILKTEDSGTSYITNTLAWGYDQMYRLTNEVSISSSTLGTYTNQYQYDKVGNRFSKVKYLNGTITTTTNLYNENDQLLKEVSLGSVTETNQYGYDANGSVVARTNIATSTAFALYGYDLKNKLANVTTNSTTTSYLYNDQGMRVRSTTGVSATHYLIDANNHTGYQQVLEELTAPGATATRSYVIGDDVLAQANGGAVSYLLYDGHGSTRQLAGTTAGVSSRYNYDAYGVNVGSSSSSAETTLLYCGEQLDSTLGMYNLRARYYNPANGTFNQRDTFAGNNFDPQSLHKYTYANGDPVNGMDPTGHFTLTELIVVIAVVFVVTGLLLPGLTKQKQKAQHTIAISTGADDVTNAIKAANIDINESRIQLSEDMHQTFLAYLKQQGEYRRQFERARAGNEILAADAVGWLHEGSGIALNVVPGVGEIEAVEAPALFENAFSGFSNGKLGQQAHDAFEEALHSLYGTQKGDWFMRTAPGMTGVDAEFIGDMTRFPGFKYGELKPYSQHSLGTFGEQLGRWGLPNGETELFFYNQGGVIGSSGFRF